MQCEKCMSEMKFFSGTSKKTGKPYAMQKCPNCENTVWVNAKPQQAYNQPAPAPQYTPKPAPTKQETDWDSKELRSHRRACLAIIASTNPGVDMQTLFAKSEDAVNFVYRGYLAQRGFENNSRNVDNEIPVEDLL